MDHDSSFPFESMDDIIEHLDAEDLLKCTLVCPTWNELIGSTRSCMKKIKLKIEENSSLKEMRKMLESSNRKYECIYLEKKSCEGIGTLLLVKNRRWTHVFIRRLHFEKTKDYFDLLALFQSTIQKLVILYGDIKEGCDEDILNAPSDLQFP